MFEIDFYIQSENLSPPNKRKERHLAWLRCLMAPMNSFKELFNVVFEGLQKRAKRTGQVIILEDTLNLTFNIGGIDPIYIDNLGDDIQLLFFYNSNEGYPAIFFYNEAEGNPGYIFNETEVSNNNIFKVYVPINVFNNFTEAQIKSEVLEYTSAGVSFQIIQY